VVRARSGDRFGPQHGCSTPEDRLSQWGKGVGRCLLQHAVADDGHPESALTSQETVVTVLFARAFALPVAADLAF